MTNNHEAEPSTKKLAAKMLMLVEHFDADDEAKGVSGEREIQIDLGHTAKRLISHELALESIRRHLQISLKGKHELSTVWMIADVALTKEN